MTRRIQDGFTLIELLVSMAILMVIVLIVGRLFQQSSQAWESGTRQAEINITGRALADFIAQEISQAIDDSENYLDPFDVPSSGMIQFNMLDLGSSGREVYKVQYSFAGGVIRRSSYHYNAYAAASTFNPPGVTSVDLAKGVLSCSFSPAPGWGSGSGLPEYVDVEIHVLSEDDLAKGFAARERTFKARAWLVNRNRYKL